MGSTEAMQTGLTWADMTARRLARHSLLAPAQDADAADVVAGMCGAHAQVMAAAELSVALRLEGATRTTVRQALWDEHSLVKTFGPRGTVHLLPARDLPLWTAALSALPPSSNDVPEEARLTEAQSEVVVEVLATVLADAELTVEELDEAMVDFAGEWAGEEVVPAWYDMWPRWRPAIYTAAKRGVLCYGPPLRRKVTYTNPQRWVSDWQPVDGQAALRELALRYLYAYGPAMPQQFAQWLAAPRGWGSELFASMADMLEAVTVEGETAWLAADDGERHRGETAEGVRLLPYFDAFVVGSHPREKLFVGRAAERALAGGQAGNYPVLLIDGQVAGVWHQRRSGRTVHIRVEPLEPLRSDQQRAVEEQAGRIGEILEGNPQLTIGPIDVGPHA